MNVEDLMAEVEMAGVTFALKGDRITVLLPPEVDDEMVARLRARREEVRQVLEERKRRPTLPSGVRLVAWEPETSPVVLTRCSVVVDVAKFIRTTLGQLEHALAGDNPFLAGHWSVRDLIERLEQVGVKLEVERQ
jgi:hypothetical protein